MDATSLVRSAGSPVDAVESPDRPELRGHPRRVFLLGATGAAAAAVLPPLFFPAVVRAQSLGSISNADATSALRAALEKGSLAAIAKLGIEGGFLNNPQVKIPLPDALRKVEKLLRATGKGDELDALVTSMNRAAELAVPESKQLLTSAIKAMSVQDAKGILTGGQDSVTQFFKSKTRAPLTERFLPIVDKTVSKLGLARSYNSLAGQAMKLGLVKEESATVQRYVTGRSLDGLYFMIGEEEKAIRQDPVKAGSKILERVFGAIR